MAVQPAAAAVLSGSLETWGEATKYAAEHGYVIANHGRDWFFEPHEDNKDFKDASLRSFWFNSTNFASHIHIHLDSKQLGITGGTVSMHCGNSVNHFCIRPPLAQFLPGKRYDELTYGTMQQALVSMEAETLARSRIWINNVTGLRDEYKDQYRSLWKEDGTGLTTKGQLYAHQWSQLLDVWREVVSIITKSKTWRYPVSLLPQDAQWLTHI